MIDDVPETQERNRVSGKLILPPYSGQLPSLNAHEQKTTAYLGQNFPPDPRLSRSATNHLEKFWYLVRKDPAYRLLLIAVVMVLISSIIFVSFASSLFFAPPQSSLPPGPAGTTVVGTVDLRPTFPPPHGGQGSTASSQPPKHATPVLTNNQNTTPQTPPPPGGALSIQITGLPGQVFNNTTVSVTVTTNQPGVTVRLVVQYNVAPGFFSSGAQTTDGGGTATLSWRIRVLGTRNTATARVIAIAQDQNGQQAISPAVTVQIVTGGVGF